MLPLNFLILLFATSYCRGHRFSFISFDITPQPIQFAIVLCQNSCLDLILDSLFIMNSSGQPTAQCRERSYRKSVKLANTGTEEKAGRGALRD